jgi:CBS domain-containing protein
VHDTKPPPRVSVGRTDSHVVHEPICLGWGTLRRSIVFGSTGQSDLVKYSCSATNLMVETKKSFSDLLVEDVYDLVVKDPTTIDSGAKIRQVFDLFLNNPVSRKVYVLNEEGKYVGAVTTETLLRLLGYRVGVREFANWSLWKLMRDMLKEGVEGVIEKVPSVKRSDKLTKALQIMVEDHFTDLPVLDDDGKLIGELNSFEIFTKGRELFDE